MDHTPFLFCSAFIFCSLCFCTFGSFIITYEGVVFLSNIHAWFPMDLLKSYFRACFSWIYLSLYVKRKLQYILIYILLSCRLHFFFVFSMAKVDSLPAARYTKAQLERIQEAVEVWRQAEPVDLMKRVNTVFSSSSYKNIFFTFHEVNKSRSFPF